MEMIEIVMTLFVLVLGLCIGSFLGVCIYRIPEKKSIVSPPSACGACGERLKPLDLIPVFSALFLRFRCRYCGEKFSSRLLWIELLTGGVYLFLFYRMGLTYDMFFALFMASIMIVVSFTDIDHKKIPNSVVLVGFIGAVLFLLVGVVKHIYSAQYAGEHALYALFAFGVLMVLSVAFDFLGGGVIGMGDAKLFIPLGLFIGKPIFILLMISVMIAGVFAILMVLFKKMTMKSSIPMAPFFSLAFIFYLQFIY